MDDMDEVMLFPITDIDNNNEGEDDIQNTFSVNERNLVDRKDEPMKPFMSLRRRRHSQLIGLNYAQLKLDIVPQVPKIRGEDPVVSPGKTRWQKAFKKLRQIKDPWADFSIKALKSEVAIRHRYSALKKKWTTDEITVKVEDESFNRGAMRACFRLKKVSNVTHDWKRAHNYVAKKYIENVERDVYFEDVKLQNDAKLWGEEYNRHKPPKKVDIFQMSILEFKDRPDKPLYHFEHFIEGEYIKYNSNNGFVDENMRLTPHAFSHFTFERSGHQMIVVDIQGVGDLWTDPQIHTAEGDDYGEGNLGTRGMALFFHSHVCNSICESMKLSKFDLAASEAKEINKFVVSLKNSKTLVKKEDMEMCISVSPSEKIDLTSFLAIRSRSRTISNCSAHSDSDGPYYRTRSYSNGSDCLSNPLSPLARDDESMDLDSEVTSPISISSPSGMFRTRTRFVSESDESAPGTASYDDDDIPHTEEELTRFQQAYSKHRPSCIMGELDIRNTFNNMLKVGDSVLGQIHHDLAKYHELGRFLVNGNDEIDYKAAIFHEEQAAELGIMEAILTMARLYLQLPRDVLVNCSIETDAESFDKGLEYMTMGAEAGDRSAMVYMAQAYETGKGLGNRCEDWFEAVRWYSEAAKQLEEDESGAYDATMDTPIYQIKAKMAEMYLAGEHGLDKDPSKSGDLYNEAADAAMAAMKGRLANKYYALAEEAWGEVEEE